MPVKLIFSYTSPPFIDATITLTAYIRVFHSIHSCSSAMLLVRVAELVNVDQGLEPEAYDYLI